MLDKEFYNNYFQKSRVFCYSVLGIKKGISHPPEECYMALKDYYKYEDCKLILHYKNCYTKNFQLFSENVLQNCSLFEKVIVLNTNEKLYVFDFTIHKRDWMRILNGQYSKISHAYKKAIESFYAKDPTNLCLVSKIIYPFRYYSEFASIVEVPCNIVKEVGEVIDLPDRIKEEFHIEEYINKYFVNLQ